MFSGIRCVSIAVNDISSATQRYCEQLGLDRIGPLNESGRGLGLRWQNLGQAGEVFLELIEPSEPDSAVARFLAKKGEGVYQVRLSTPDIDETLDTVQSRGARVVRDKHWRPGMRKLGWIHPSATHGVLLELVEDERDASDPVSGRSAE